MRDQDTVEELYRGCYHRLVQQLYPVTGELKDAQDVVQDAFARLLAVPGRVNKLDNPEAWLRTVAVNHARSRWRRRTRWGRLLPRYAATQPSVIPGASPDHVALMTALRQLPDNHRTAVALHYLADLPVADVATTLGAPEGSVKVWLARGRARLATLLTDHPTAERSEQNV
ncbi:MAG: RNA polymerase sigma factor [Micromonosporaceae bacterium]